MLMLVLMRMMIPPIPTTTTTTVRKPPATINPTLHLPPAVVFLQHSELEGEVMWREREGWG